MFDNISDGEAIGSIRFDITKNASNPYPVDIRMETELGWQTFVIAVINGLTTATEQVTEQFLGDALKDAEVPAEWLETAVPIVSQYLLDEVHEAADGLSTRMQWFHANTDGLTFEALNDFVDGIVALRDANEAAEPDDDEVHEDG